MNRAGYDVAEAGKVWGNLALELKARPDQGKQTNPLFATHPPREEREAALAELALAYKGGETNEGPWLTTTAPFLREWLRDEVKRGQHEESIAFLTRAAARPTAKAEYLYARGEVRRLRAGENDLDGALEDFRAAVAAGGEPPETHRGLGMVYRLRKRVPEAQASFERYLQLAPEAPDALMIRNHIEELRA
jgi:tetratricopeptide (TPR) repeat protein